jgi:DNA polymerase-3 subunit chi
MTRVDFYLLNDPGDRARDLAVCRLTQKAFGLGHRVYILSGDPSTAGRLDELLWTFSPGSFVPHELHSGSDPATACPVLIGPAPPAGFDDVLISLAREVPECFHQFSRVAEVVEGDETAKAGARDRFRFYRDRGCEPQTHNL